MNPNLLETMEHEQVIFCSNPSSKLQAIIAIHNTVLGPALGGTRMYPYTNMEEALKDVFRLSKGMTYKSAAAGLNFGGGKAVILGDPKKDKSESLFRAFGAFVERLKGQFITGEDVGIDVNDTEFMFMETDYVVGLSEAHGGSGDPAQMTAYGLIQGMQACVEKRLQRSNLKNLKVAVQGLGHVGSELVRLLQQEGAEVIACDKDAQKAKEVEQRYGIEIVSPEAIYDVPCDIFSPCSMGGILSKKTIPRLHCAIVAGAANNQFDEGSEEKLLQEKNILYAPDYVINAGGLINVACELEGYSKHRAQLLTRNIFYNLRHIFEIAQSEKIPAQKAADRLVEKRLQSVEQIRRSHFLDKSKIRRSQHL